MLNTVSVSIRLVKMLKEQRRDLMRSDFSCVILCHGRPHNTPTFSTLRKYGYTGAIYIICDDEDKTLQEYRNIYGDDIVKVFNKLDV